MTWPNLLSYKNKIQSISLERYNKKFPIKDSWPNNNSKTTLSNPSTQSKKYYQCKSEIINSNTHKSLIIFRKQRNNNLKNKNNPSKMHSNPSKRHKILSKYLNRPLKKLNYKSKIVKIRSKSLKIK